MISPYLARKPRTLVHIERHPELGEFRVIANGAGEACAYYTDSRQDARDTARAQWGVDCVIMERTRRYGEC